MNFGDFSLGADHEQ